MSQILKEWIWSRLSLDMSSTPECMAEAIRHGNLIGKLLFSYGIIDHEQLRSLRSEQETVKERDSLLYLAPWLDAMGVECVRELLEDIQNNDASASLKLLYQLYVALEDKSRLHFITAQLMRERIANPSKFDVAPVDEVELYSHQEEESPYFKPISENQDKLYYFRTRYQEITEKMKKSRKRFLSYMENLTAYEPKHIPLGAGEEINRDDIAFLPADLSEGDIPYEQLMEAAEQAKNIKVPQADMKKAAAYVEQLKKEHKKRMQETILSEQAYKNATTEVWRKMIDDQEKDFDKEVTLKLLKQSQHEKQMMTKMLEVCTQKQVIVEHKQMIDDMMMKKRIEEDVNSAMTAADMAAKELEYSKVEKERMQEVKARLSEDQNRRDATDPTQLSQAIASDLVDLAVRKSEHRSILGTDPPRRLLEEWSTLFRTGQPIFDVAEDIVHIVQEEMMEPEEILDKETERQAVLDQNEFERYLNYEWPWQMEDLLPEDHGYPEMMHPILMGEEVLSHIVHILLKSKYPLVIPEVPSDLRTLEFQACIRGITDLDCLPTLQNLLKEKGITVILMQDAINFCVDAYNEESRFEEDDDIIEDTNRSNQKSKKAKKASKKKSKKRGVKRKDKNKQSQDGSRSSKTMDASGDMKMEDLNKQTQTPRKLPLDEDQFSEHARIGKRMAKALLSGEPLTNELLVQGLMHYIRSLSEMNGWVLINYPETAEQVVALEEALTNQTLESLRREAMYQRSPYDEGEDSENESILQNRRSKVLKEPSLDPQPDQYKSGLSAYIDCRPLEKDFTEEETFTMIEENADCVEKFYSYQGNFSTLLYKEFDLSTLKHLGKLVIGDESVPPKSSVELFGDALLYLEMNKPMKGDKKSVSKKKDKSAKRKAQAADAGTTASSAETKSQKSKKKNKGKKKGKDDASEDSGEKKKKKKKKGKDDDSEDSGVKKKKKKKGKDDDSEDSGERKKKKKGKGDGSEDSGKKKKGKKGKKVAKDEISVKGKKLKEDKGKKKKKKKKGSSTTDTMSTDKDLPADEFGQGDGPSAEGGDGIPLPPARPGEPEWRYVHMSLPEKVYQGLAAIWEATETSYESNFKDLFFYKRTLLNAVVPYAARMKEQMHSILHKPDKKQEYLTQFQTVFNQLDPDWRDDEEVKAELHCRVVEFCDKLLEMCDQNLFEAEEERKKLIAENWLAESMKQLANMGVDSMQLELDRSANTMTILKEYFDYKTAGKSDSYYESLTLSKMSFDTPLGRQAETDIVKFLTTLSIDSDVSNPFCDAVEIAYKKALQYVEKFRTSSTECKKRLEKASKLGGSSYRFKSRDRSPLSDETESKIKTQAMVDEYMVAAEGELLRVALRLDMIKERWLRDIKECSQIAQSMFEEMRADISINYQDQLHFLDDACKVFGIAIEAGHPIRPQLALISDRLEMRKFIMPAAEPELLDETLEETPDRHFTGQQLMALAEILADIAPSGSLPTKALICLLEDQLAHDGDDTAVIMPAIWQSVPLQKLPTLVRDIIGGQSGIFNPSDHTNWRDFLVRLSEVRPPTEEQLMHVRQQFRECDPELTELVPMYSCQSIRLWMADSSLEKFLYYLYTFPGGVNYTDLLLAFCKDSEPVQGLAKALALSLGRPVCSDAVEGERYRLRKLRGEARSSSAVSAVGHILRSLVQSVVPASENPTPGRGLDGDEADDEAEGYTVEEEPYEDAVPQVKTPTIKMFEDEVTYTGDETEEMEDPGGNMWQKEEVVDQGEEMGQAEEVADQGEEMGQEEEANAPPGDIEETTERDASKTSIIMESALPHPLPLGPRLHFLPFAALLAVISASVPWHTIYCEDYADTVRSKLEDLFLPLRDEDFGDNVFVHEFLNDKCTKELLDQMGTFTYRSPLQLIDAVLKDAAGKADPKAA